jgi:hypothetical protein
VAVGLREQVRRLQTHVEVTSETVPLRDGSGLTLGPDGRAEALMCVLEKRTDHPLVQAVLTDQVDVEATLALDLDLGAMVNLLRCLTAPLRSEQQGEGGV